MKFINRITELEQLEEYYTLSKKHLIIVAISGLRRVGKTTLAKEFIKNKKAIYFFVYESKTSLELLREFSEELRKHKIITPIENIGSWHSFFETLFERCRDYVIIFDEFQNFYKLDKAVFSILQKNCDENKTAPLNIILLGSLIGLFRKIFEDKKLPLYGRISSKLSLLPFNLSSSIEALKHITYKDKIGMVKIYGLFGGFPKYYAALEQFNLTNMDCFGIIEYLFVQENAPLENEVAVILKQEFGRRSQLYYSILHSIAIGKTKLNEIAANTGMKESSITRHVSELEERFSLIKSSRPFDNKKNTRYFISHPLIKFWFKFIYDKFSEYSLRDTPQLMQLIKNEFNSFFGKRFEEICKEIIIEMNLDKKLPFNIEHISNWWGSARIEGVRQEIEIDLIALNQKTKQILFTECKWQDNVDGEKVLHELKEKSRFVNWQKEKREEYFCVIAKSFKGNAKEKNCLLLELDDLI